MLQLQHKAFTYAFQNAATATLPIANTENEKGETSENPLKKSKSEGSWSAKLKRSFSRQSSSDSSDKDVSLRTFDFLRGLNI